MLVYGSLGFGILAVVIPLALYRVDRVEVPVALSVLFGMASLTCVSAVMGMAALEEDASIFLDTAPTFMWCSIALFAMVVAINAWLLWRASHKRA